MMLYVNYIFVKLEGERKKPIGSPTEYRGKQDETGIF